MYCCTESKMSASHKLHLLYPRERMKGEGGRPGQLELQKINRVYSFKGSRHRLFIVQANYQRKIITTDGSGVTDFSYALLWAEQMKKRESYLKKAKHLTVKELHSPDGDLLSLPIIFLTL